MLRTTSATECEATYKQVQPKDKQFTFVRIVKETNVSRCGIDTIGCAVIVAFEWLHASVVDKSDRANKSIAIVENHTLILCHEIEMNLIASRKIRLTFLFVSKKSW
jgi:hypothetical protein